MHITKLFTDERAVAPVVGVILMVAVTVLLAATAASFFIGITNDAKQQTPQAAFDFDYEATASHDDDRLTITHASGDDIDADQVTVAVSGAEAGGSTVDERIDWTDFSGSSASEVTAGVSVTVEESEFSGSTLSLEQASVEVVWQDPGGSGSVVLADWSAPTEG